MTAQTVTWDSVNKGSSVTLSNGNLTAITPNSSNTVRASIGRANGKWYLEIKVDSVSQIAIGIVNAAAGVGNTVNSVNSMYYLSYGGTKVHNTSNVAYGATYSTGDIISILLNLNESTIEFWKNGISQGVAFTTVSTLGEVFPAVVGTSGAGGGTVTANFGASKFAYEIPKDYYSYDGNQYGGYNKFLIATENKIYSVAPSLLVPAIKSAMTSGISIEGASIPETPVGSYLAFDKIIATNNRFNSGGVPSVSSPKYIGFKFNRPLCIREFELFPYNINDSPKDFKIMASNDGVIWETLETKTGVTDWTIGIGKKISFENKRKYFYYRLETTASVGSSSYFSITEVQMYEYIQPKLFYLTSSSEQTFLEHGANTHFTIDMSEELFVKKFVQESSIQLGSGKVFKQKIDTSKISIKKASIT